MIADYDNMPMAFYDCNDKYFDGKLPTPKFGLIHKTSMLGWFGYRKKKKRIATGNPLNTKSLKCQIVMILKKKIL